MAQLCKSNKNLNEERAITKTPKYQCIVKHMDVILNGLSISAKGELQSLCCMMGKTISHRCHFLAVNGWRLIG